MATSDKLNYLLDTKEAIKTSLINKGVEVNNTDTFRSYSEKIDSIKTTVDTENVEVTPTKETQIINRSENKYIESVTINPIPDEYIVPTGELAITENGQYDITDKASVNVEVSGGGIDEYFDTIITSHNGTNTSVGEWYKQIKKFPTLEMNGGRFLNYFFYGCPFETLNVSKIKTNECEYMNDMFSYCRNLTSLDLSNFDTSNVTKMNSMFSNCENLTSLDLSNFDTSNVTDMSFLFNLCKNLTSLDLSSFNTSKVTSMSSMFSNCKNLTNLDLSNFNTSKVTSMSSMFMGCTNLISLNVSSFDTSNVTSMNSMITSSGFISLDLSNFDMSKVNNNANIIYNNYYLTNLIFGYNLGKGYTQKSSNYAYYTIDLQYSYNITHDSLMDVINKLYDLNLTYDVANGGTLYTQKLLLGNNKTKLTEEEIAIATNKGWNIV